MPKRKYTYFYCTECKLSESSFAKVSALAESCEKISITNFPEIQRQIEEDVRRFVKEKRGETPYEIVIISLTCLHEDVEAPSLTLLHGNAEDE